MSDKDQNVAVEGDHMTATDGTIVQTRDSELPYKVILKHQNAGPSEHAFPTMRECEAFIRRNTPLPVARSTPFDPSRD